MLRPNLAAEPFLDSRPVIAAGAMLALVAIAATAFSIVEVISAHGQETQIAERVRQLDTHRDTLSREVVTLDRKLAATPWKKLKVETASMSEIVVKHRPLWGSLFTDLERVLPWDIRLVSIVPQTGPTGEVTIGLTGVAAGRAGWLKLLGRLFTDPHFSDPLPQSEETASAQNGVGFRFDLRVRYWPEGRP
jgi:hypothetical protein